MRSIEFADYVYEFLVQNTKEIGEDASSILRRLLNISDRKVSEIDRVPSNRSEQAPPKRVYPVESPAKRREELHQNKPGDVRTFLQSGSFRRCNSVTERYLEALRWIHHYHQEEFHRIATIRGSKRVYFSQSELEIANSGNATQPRKIDGTRWFAMTNNDSANKRDILKEVMRQFNFSPGDANLVSNSLATGFTSGIQI